MTGPDARAPDEGPDEEAVAQPGRRSSRWWKAALLAITLAVFVIALLVTRARMRDAVAPPPPTEPPAVDFRTQRIAIPDCVPRGADEASSEACRALTGVLRADLDFEGILDVVPDGAAESPEPPARWDLGRWRSQGARVLVLVDAAAAGADVTVEVAFLHVETGRALTSRVYRGTDTRALAHQLSDELMAMAGLRGIARTRIAFNSDRHSGPRGPIKEIYVVDYDGHGARRLTTSVANYAAPGINIMPSWHPDGDRLAYVSFTQGSANIFVARLPEGSRTNLTAGRGLNFAAVWSPDGERMAFSSTRSGNSEIWVANADGSSPRRLTTSAAADTAPAWSPTGREIAFTSDRSGRPQVYVMKEDGLDVRLITTEGKYNDAADWNPSPDYPEIAYTSLGKGGFEIAVVDLATGVVRKVATERGDCEYPTWAPSGRHIAFACREAGRRQITVSDRLGQNIRTLAAGPGNNDYPDWGP